jgi:hypothetical protein
MLIGGFGRLAFSFILLKILLRNERFQWLARLQREEIATRESGPAYHSAETLRRVVD